MAVLRSDGVIFRQRSRGDPLKHIRGYTWFPVRASGKNSYVVDIRSIVVPKEFAGKKVRIKLEVMKE